MENSEPESWKVKQEKEHGIVIYVGSVKCNVVPTKYSLYNGDTLFASLYLYDIPDPLFDMWNEKMFKGNIVMTDKKMFEGKIVMTDKKMFEGKIDMTDKKPKFIYLAGFKQELSQQDKLIIINIFIAKYNKAQEGQEGQQIPILKDLPISLDMSKKIDQNLIKKIINEGFKSLEEYPVESRKVISKYLLSKGCGSLLLKKAFIDLDENTIVFAESAGSNYQEFG